MADFKVIKGKTKADDRGRVTLNSALANQQFAVLVNEQGQYLLDPISENPREGWKEAFEKMHAEGDDKLDPDYELMMNGADNEDWTW
ncbi:MAG: hypothetical protein ACFB4I_11685 [Cyanophyceae cyanobacterium]